MMAPGREDSADIALVDNLTGRNIGQSKINTDPQFEMPFPLKINTIATPSKPQKALAQWFDSHPSANSPDIYLPEWRERIASWQRSADGTPGTPTSKAQSKQWLAKLDLSKLFAIDCIALVSLWNLLQALYELDRAVCGKSEAVAKWEELPPFAYMTAPLVEKKWRDSLSRLRRRILDRTISNDEFMRCMYEIRCAVDKVEDLCCELKDSFLDNLGNEVFVEEMLNEIEKAVNWRFSAIDKTLLFDEKDLHSNEDQRLEDNFRNEQEPFQHSQNQNGQPDFSPRMLSRGSRRNSMRDYVMIIFDISRLGSTSVYIAIVVFFAAFYVYNRRHTN